MQTSGDQRRENADAYPSSSMTARDRYARDIQKADAVPQKYALDKCAVAADLFEQRNHWS